MSKKPSAKKTKSSSSTGKSSAKQAASEAKYVYFFGGGSAEGDNAGLPVPPGFTVSTEACTVYYEQRRRVPAAIDAEMDRHLAELEKLTGAKLGSPDQALLVSVRSGAKFSMPGMMDTVLNLGLNDETTEGLARKSNNPRFAYDCYRRFMQMFGSVVLEVGKDDFEHVFDGIKKKRGAKFDTDLTPENLQEVVAAYKRLVQKKTKSSFPQDPMEQLRMARDAVFRSWFNPRAYHYRRMNDISVALGTAVNVQTMVFGNLGETSGTGVGFTRNPATGEAIRIRAKTVVKFRVAKACKDAVVPPKK